jgi:hypothetical protein
MTNISLRGHSMNKYNDILIVYGGVSGFNKFSNKIYEISLKVYFNLFLYKRNNICTGN